MNLTLLAALLVAATTVQDAQAQLELTIGGGLNAPGGEYGDQVNTGYALTTGLGYRFMPLVAVGAELGYNANGGSEEALLADLGPGYTLNSSILQYSAMAKFMLPVGTHNVFAKGSVGNYRGSADLSGPLGQGSITTTHVGFGIGAGFLINSSTNSSFFADVTRHHVTFDGDGGDTNFLAVTVGALIKFDLFHESELEKRVREDLDRLED